MMRKNEMCLLSLVMLFFLTVGFSDSALAGSAVGGQVNVKGQITFYEASSSTEPSSKPIDSSTPTPTVQKPAGGSLANLGDQIGHYKLIGLALILFFLFLLLYKRKKKEER